MAFASAVVRLLSAALSGVNAAVYSFLPPGVHDWGWFPVLEVFCLALLLTQAIRPTRLGFWLTVALFGSFAALQGYRTLFPLVSYAKTVVDSLI
jgi:hypothetical protein